MNKIIDGKNISAQIRDEIKTETEILKKENGIVPGLAFIIAGDDPASKVYVKNKGKACEEAGFHSVTEVLPEGITEIQLLELIWKYNADENIHGILTQLPLPSHIDPQRVIEAIDPKKDVDGFHPVNVGKLSIGEKCFIPCTPFGIIELLRREKIETSGKHAVIIGRSNIVGKPVASLLLGKDMNSTVTVCHSRTADIKSITSQADILIAAIGRADFVKKDFIKDGAVIIDVGINRVEDESRKSGYRITGDVDFEDCFEKCSKITPVPGGVGPMTIAMLMRNTLDSAKGEIFG
ncbi:MAG: bifunctional methylenetetrahydrofolate dehydrogenase/methenyltetrahydrofolate cyclohydrolase FolD [Ignavibacteria bacterium]